MRGLIEYAMKNKKVILLRMQDGDYVTGVPVTIKSGYVLMKTDSIYREGWYELSNVKDVINVKRCKDLQRVATYVHWSGRRV